MNSWAQKLVGSFFYSGVTTNVNKAEGGVRLRISLLIDSE